MTASPRRTGATLIETLTVIGAVGLLLGILLPAVLHVREASRSAECKSRLSGFGKALHLYEASHGHFPAALEHVEGDPHRGSDKSFSPHVFLLPFVEESQLYFLVNGIEVSPGRHLGEDSLHAPRIGPLALARVSSFLCPSDPAEGGNNFRVCLGPGAGEMQSRLSKDGGLGAFAALKRLGSRDCTDGLSNTVSACEKLKSGVGGGFSPRSDFWFTGAAQLGPMVPEADEMASLCRALSSEPSAFHSEAGTTWMFASYAQTWYNHVLAPNVSTADCTVLSHPGRNIGGAGAYRANSFHPGGVNTLMTDGAVRFVADGIDLSVWRAVSTRSGGETTPLF